MKKGFTLIEVLAVITIFSLLLILVAPGIINKIKSKQEDVNNVQTKIIINSAELYFNENPSKNCVTVQELEDSGKLTKSYLDSKGKATTASQLNKHVNKGSSTVANGPC